MKKRSSWIFPILTTFIGILNFGTSSADDSVGRFLAEQYASDSRTGGIQEALDACHSAGGGTVVVPAGKTTIDGSLFESPAISLPAIGTRGSFVGGCVLQGHGRGTALWGGSTLYFKNMAAMKPTRGDRVAIQMTASGQSIRHLNIFTDHSDATSIALLCESRVETHRDPGETGINNWNLTEVNISGSGAGSGFETRFCLKGSITNTHMQHFDSGFRMKEVACTDNFDTPARKGVQTSGPPDGRCDHRSSHRNRRYRLGSNAISISGMVIRTSKIGLEIADSYSCENISITGSTIEGNGVGILFGPKSRCILSGFGNHFENSDVANVLITSSTAKYRSFGSWFGGRVDHDIVRAVAQDSNSGPDLVIGAHFDAGPYYTNGARLRLLNTSEVNEDLVGSVFGVAQTYPTDCPANAMFGVSGDLCIETSRGLLYFCKPIKGRGKRDGVCDSKSEWVRMMK